MRIVDRALNPIHCLCLGLLLCGWFPQLSLADSRPNFVWIVSEDNSIHYLAHFFEGGVSTPNIEAMASRGLTFTHAFSNAPVCSVARTTLATSCYAPRIAAQFHRPYRKVPLPNGLKMFPAYLRDGGYYTSNNRKKDYNFIEPAGVWDESSRKASWRNRPDKDQPFFHMQSHNQSHESSLHFKRRQMADQSTSVDPQSVQLAGYHPDTPTFRYTQARYLDRMKTIDEIVGRTIEKLKQDGLLEDTFVFYFGDHGGVLPRGKGYVYESGLHVPLVVRVPKNFRHLVDGKDGERVGGFVSFIDFGPTVLQLAGLKVPAEVDGRPFLGNQVSMDEVNSRDVSLGYADRMDEKYDLVRTIRKGRFQYIRNYQPYLPDGLNNNYRYKSLAYQEWRQLFLAGKLKAVQRQFFEPKPVEQLFDCDADPHQINNLAGVIEHRRTLMDLRKRLNGQLKRLPDLSFYPESYLAKHAMPAPIEFGRQHRQEIGQLVDLADLALMPFEQVETPLRRALKSQNSMERYWAATCCAVFGKRASGLATEVRALLTDVEPTVRIRAAEFLGLTGSQNPQPILTRIVNETEDPIVATEALNAVVLFRDFHQYPTRRSDFRPRCQGADIERRLNYLNGTPFPGTK